MIRSTIAELFAQEIKHIDVEVKGWVKSFRANRFIALNDGSTLQNIQCVVDFESMEGTYFIVNIGVQDATGLTDNLLMRSKSFCPKHGFVFAYYF